MERQIIYFSPYQPIAEALGSILDLIRPENAEVLSVKDLDVAKEKIEAGEVRFVLLHVTSEESVSAAKSFLREIKDPSSPYKSVRIAVLSAGDKYEQSDFISLGADVTIDYDNAVQAIEGALHERNT